MNIVSYIIRRPVAVTMFVVAVVALGILAIMRLPVSLLPDVDIPQVTVQVSSKGSSAKQIDETIVRSLRSRLSQLSGLNGLESVSEMDAATITLSFRHGTNIDIAFIDVNEKVDMAMGVLPEGTERPKVIKSSVTDIPAFFVDLTLDDAVDDMEHFIELSDFASSVVRKRIEQLPQTAMVDVSGTIGQKIILTPDYDKLQATGLTTDDIEQALEDNDISVEALSVRDGQYRYNIHFDSQLLDCDDIANIRINYDGRILQLSDLCDIRRKVGVRNGIVRHNGKNAITMAVIKQADAKMSDLRSGIDTTLTDLRSQYPNIHFDITRDQTELLSFSISNLESNLLTSALLTFLVLLAFMHSWRPALLVGLTIPLSLVATMLFFRLFGISLNVISLSGLILGVGMIVDNSIIVTDNILRKWNGGIALPEATARAAAEVFTPMLSSVLTTCSVFVPLVFLSGLAGDLFYDQAMGISISLLVSLAVAVLVVPVYYFRFYHSGKKPPLIADNKADRALLCLYERGMGFTLRHGRLLMVLFLVSIPCTVGVFMLIDKQRMPEVEQTETQMVVNWNEGITDEESDRRMAELMRTTTSLAREQTTLAGTQQFLLTHTPNITSSEAVGYIKCNDQEQLAEACRRIRQYADSAYANATIEFFSAGNPFDLMLGSDEGTLKIRFQTLRGERPTVEQAEALVDSLRGRFGGVYVPAVMVDNNLRCRADLWQMALYHISYSDLLTCLRELTGENRVMDINDGNQTIPVVIGTDNAEREKILGSNVINSQGVAVPISYLLHDSVVNDYKRLFATADGEFYPVEINCSSDTARLMMNYADQLRSSTPDTAVSFAGSYFESRELIRELLGVLCVALALLFFIMAAQFESLVQPLIILSEILFDCFVVLLVLWVLDMSLNLMSMIGIVVMSGIVINDSILKIDTINRLRRQGMTTLRAIVTAGHERLRPILMTSATTMLAVVPFLSRGDIGSDLQYPISITTIVGMGVGTLVSLFFVPLLYYVIYRKR